MRPTTVFGALLAMLLVAAPAASQDYGVSLSLLRGEAEGFGLGGYVQVPFGVRAVSLRLAAGLRAAPDQDRGPVSPDRNPHDRDLKIVGRGDGTAGLRDHGDSYSALLVFGPRLLSRLDLKFGAGVTCDPRRTGWLCPREGLSLTALGGVEIAKQLWFVVELPELDRGVETIRLRIEVNP